MPNKRPNFQRIIPTIDPPKVVDKPKEEEDEEKKPEVERQEPEPYFQKRTVRFDIPKTPVPEEKTEAKEEELKPYYAAHDTFTNPKKDPKEEELLKNDPFYSLRKNYAVNYYFKTQQKLK